jgi:hypothetical protein
MTIAYFHVSFVVRPGVSEPVTLTVKQHGVMYQNNSNFGDPGLNLDPGTECHEDICRSGSTNAGILNHDTR